MLYYIRTWHDDKGVASLNSEGLPNNGIDYYISSSTIHETMGDNPSNKPYMVSISGKNLEQNLDMLKKIAEVVKSQDESSSKADCDTVAERKMLDKVCGGKCVNEKNAQVPP